MSNHRSPGQRRRRRTARAAVLGVAVATLAQVAVQGTASAAPSGQDWRDAVRNARQQVDLAAKQALEDRKGIRPASLGRAAAGGEFDRSQFPARGPVSVMLQLRARAAVRAYAAARPDGAAAARAAGREQREAVESVARDVARHFDAPATRARELYRVTNVFAGIAVRTTAGRLEALNRIGGVAAVRPLPTYHVTNASSVPLIGAPDVWNGGSNIGTDVKIGVIDTGIDYTHANFGGSGSRRAYEADHQVADADTLNVPSGDFPSDKVVGGVDLVGDAYDPESDDPAVFTPQPDPNPLDCNGHGSHVAGSATGLGVNADGSTFEGDYSTLSSLDPADYRAQFRIGPGVAPGADLYGIRVFGCDGSTNVVVEALDWAADPDGNGNFADHLDVVNMSLGADYASPDGADAIASNNLSLLGTTVVSSAGNASDAQGILGTPAAASRAIAVAATSDALEVLDAMQENAPDNQQIAGQRSVAFDWANEAPVTGDVQAATPDYVDGTDPETGNADGCDPFTPEQTALVEGKIAWLEWTDDDATRRCGSAGRSANAVAAGAIGAVFSDDAEHFAAGITGSDVVPVFQIRNSDSDALRAAAQAGTLNVTLTYDLRNSVQVIDENLVDQIASFSSRGWGADTIKPDVAAPGVSTFSTASGTGDEGVTESGTSMASPHVAGIAALVKAAHPGWFPEQIKAAIVNTADHDVFSTPANDRDPSTDRAAPDRVGSGRVDAARASDAQVIAYSFGTQGGVGVSFGTPEVTEETTYTRLVKVENPTGADETYDVGYTPANEGTDAAGVDISFDPTITVPAHATRTLTITMSVDPSQLEYVSDSSRAFADPFGLGISTDSFLPEESGWLTLSQTSTERMRLPLYAAPQPASDMAAADPALSFGDQVGGIDVADLALEGTGWDNADHQSLVSGYELGASSPEKPSCSSADDDPSACTMLPSDKAADLRYVGATSDYPVAVDENGDPLDELYPPTTTFAVSTYGDWRSIGEYEYDVLVDGDGDGAPDGALFNLVYPDTDTMLTFFYDLKHEDADNPIDVEFVNATLSGADTNVFDNRVLELPVWSSALAQVAPDGDFTYWVESYSADTGFNDATDPVGFDWSQPGLSVVDGAFADNAYAWGTTFAPLHWLDVDGNTLTIRRDKAQLQQDGSGGLLLIHQNNVGDKTAEVVDATDQTETTVSLDRSTAPYSAPVKATVEVTAPSGPEPTGDVQLLVDGDVVKTATLEAGSATVELPRIDAGDHTVAARYVGDSADQPSTSEDAALTVTKQGTVTDLKARKARVHKGHRDVFTVTVSPAAGTTATPVGSVRFRVDGKVWKTVSLVDGVAKVSERHWKRGEHRVKAIYLGNDNQKRSRDAVTITVV